MKFIFLVLVLFPLLVSAQDPVEDSNIIPSRSWGFTKSPTETAQCFNTTEKETTKFVDTWGFTSSIKFNFKAGAVDYYPEVILSLRPVDEGNISPALVDLLDGNEFFRIQLTGYSKRNSQKKLKDIFLFPFDEGVGAPEDYKFKAYFKNLEDLNALLTQVRIRNSLLMNFQYANGEQIKLLPKADSTKDRNLSMGFSLSGSSKSLEGAALCLGLEGSKNSNFDLLKREEYLRGKDILDATNSNSEIIERLKEEIDELSGEELLLKLAENQEFFLTENPAEPQQTQSEYQTYLNGSPYKDLRARKATNLKVTQENRKQIEDSQAIVTEGGLEIVAQNKNLEESQKKQGVLEGQTQGLKDTYDENNKKYTELLKGHDPLTADYNKAYNKYSPEYYKLRALKTKKSEFETSFSTSEDRIEDIDSELETLRSDLPAAETAAEEAFDEFIAFSFEDYEAEILREFSSELSRLDREIESLESTNSSLEGDLPQLRTDLEDLGDDLSEKVEALPKLKVVVRESGSLREVMDNQLKPFSSDLWSLFRNKESLGEAAGDLEEALTLAQETLADLKEQEKDFEKTNTNLEKRIKRNREELRTAQNTGDIERIPKLQARISTLGQQQRENNNELRGVQNQMSGAERAVGNAQSSYDSKLVEVEQNLANITSKQKAFERFGDLLIDSDNEIKFSVTWSCDTPSDFNSFCESEISSVYSQLGEIKKDKESELRGLERDIENMKAELSEKRTELSAKSDLLRSNKEKIRTKTVRVKEIKRSAKTTATEKQRELRQKNEAGAQRLKTMRNSVASLSTERLKLQESMVLIRQEITLLIPQIAAQQIVSDELYAVVEAKRAAIKAFEEETGFVAVKDNNFASKKAYDGNLEDIRLTKAQIVKTEELIAELEAKVLENQGLIATAETNLLALKKELTEEIEPAIEAVDSIIAAFEKKISEMIEAREVGKASLIVISESLFQQ